MWIYGVKDSEGKDMPLEVRVFGPRKEEKELTDEEKKAKEEKSKKTKKKVAIGIVAGAAAVIGGLLGYSKYADSKKRKESLPNPEEDTQLLEVDDDSYDDDDTADTQETDEE